MESFTYFAPTRLLFGPGKLNELGDQELPGKRALLVTTGGKSVKANGYLARVEAQLDRAGVEHVLFDRIEPNPLRDTVNAGGWMARVEHCDFVLALAAAPLWTAARASAWWRPTPGVMSRVTRLLVTFGTMPWAVPQRVSPFQTIRFRWCA